MIVDRIYGLIIGEILADVMSNLSNINNQVNLLPRIASPMEADVFDIPRGQWTEPTALLLTYINHIMSTVNERQRALKYTCSGVFCGTLNDYPLALYKPVITCYYYTDFEQCLQFLKEDGNNPWTKLWTAIVDLAMHDVPKGSILNPESYSNLNLSQDIYDIFEVGEEGTLYRLGEANTISEQMKAILHIFSYCRNFVDGMLQVVNFINQPQVPSCLYGQLAGAFYGFTDVPSDWIKCLQKRKYINTCIEKLIKSPAIVHVAKHEQRIKRENESKAQQLNGRN